jgi:hypothetical protein
MIALPSADYAPGRAVKRDDHQIHRLHGSPDLSALEDPKRDAYKNRTGSMHLI